MPRRLWLLIAFLTSLAVLAVLWQWLAFNDVLTPEMLRQALDRLTGLSREGWMPAVVLAAFVVGSLLVFPLSILVAATGLIYGTAWGFVYALAGTLLAAVVTYWVGRALGREAVVRHGGQRLNRLARVLARRGVSTMIIISLLPLAPFTLTNMMAGAFRLRFRDYLLGTLIGILPGLLAMAVVGSQLASLLQAEDLGAVAWTAAAVTLVVALVAVLRRYARRRERELE